MAFRLSIGVVLDGVQVQQRNPTGELVARRSKLALLPLPGSVKQETLDKMVKWSCHGVPGSSLWKTLAPLQLNYLTH